MNSTQSSHSTGLIATPPRRCFYVQCQLGINIKSRFLTAEFRRLIRSREIHPRLVYRRIKRPSKTPIDAQRPAGIFNVRGINEVTQNYFRHFAGATVPLARLAETPLGSVWPQALLQPGSHHRLAISVCLGAWKLREAVGGPAFSFRSRAWISPPANGRAPGDDAGALSRVAVRTWGATRSPSPAMIRTRASSRPIPGRWSRQSSIRICGWRPA